MAKPAIPNEFQTILAKLGIGQQSIHRIRFGGVVGKQALVTFGGLLGLAVLAFKAHDLILQWGCLIAIGVVTMYGITAMGFHGHKHPVEATLEGAEIIAWKHIQQGLAIKGAGDVMATPGIVEGMGGPKLEAQEKGGK